MTIEIYYEKQYPKAHLPYSHSSSIFVSSITTMLTVARQSVSFFISISLRINCVDHFSYASWLFVCYLEKCPSVLILLRLCSCYWVLRAAYICRMLILCQTCGFTIFPASLWGICASYYSFLSCAEAFKLFQSGLSTCPLVPCSFDNFIWNLSMKGMI